MKTFVTILGMLLVLCMVSSSAFAAGPHSVRTTQGIYGPEGMNMTGEITTPVWTNPPPEADLAGIQTGGHFLLDSTSFWRRYHTVVNVPGDFAAGTYQWLFTSGPSTNYYGNKWSNTTVSIDTIQTYTKEGASNNSITATSGYYTVNFRDNGYANTQAVWIQTATQPVPITSVTKSPLIASASVPETLTVKTWGISNQENFFIRYSTNNFATSTILPVPIAVGDTIGQAIIPGQIGGTTVTYYAFSSKQTSPTTDFDLVTLQYNNNNNANYSYTISSSTYKIAATSGPNGTISPPDTTTVPSNGNQLYTFTPSAGYYVDNVLVDNVSIGNPTSYQFSNVTSNHTISVTFWHNVNVTFQVNMKVMFAKGFFQTGDTVSVNGSFNSYTPKANLLTDVGHDSIYQATLSIRAESNIAYKFWKSRGPLYWEDDISNRTDSVGDVDVVIPVAFFDNQYSNINVTFQVNMGVQMLQGSFRPDSGDVIQVRGDFNSWGTPPDTLTDPNHDSIYTKTISIPAQASYGFKFWKTYRNGQDYEIIGGTPVTNRGLTLGSHDTTLPVLYYNDDSASPTTTVSYIAGWNLISIPRTCLDYSKIGFFPNAISNAFKYAGSYIITSVLENRIGFWVKLRSDTMVVFTGAPRTYDTDSLNPGWNMIGTLSSAVVAASITPNPSNAVISKYFGYNHGYKIVDTLLPGMGYWVKADTVATLFLTSSGPSAKPAAKSQSSFETFDKLTVRDAKGNEQVLYLSHDNIQKNIYEMPPVPFSEAFDVRFSSNRFVEQVAADRNQDFPISISGATYPVTISWETKSASSGLSIASGKQEKALSGSSSIRITSANENVHILASSSLNIPKVFALVQNYPNPFNPTTNIRFDVPEQAMVQITVYNVLGERVADLVSSVQNAGSHSLEWNATDNAGQQLASGVYFYSIKATSVTDVNKTFQSVKKMMYLR